MAFTMLLLGSRDPSTPDVGAVLGPSAVAFLGHLALFGVLGALAISDLYFATGRATIVTGVVAASILGLAWGVATESYQAFVPGRDAALFDVAVDLLGAAIGAGIVAALWRMITSLTRGGQTAHTHSPVQTPACQAVHPEVGN